MEFICFWTDINLILVRHLFVYSFLICFGRTIISKPVLYTGLFEMIVGVLTTCHTQYP